MNGNQYDNFKESRADNISMQRNMTRVKNYKKIKNRLVDTDKSFFCLEHSMHIHYGNMMYIQNKKIFWETDYVFCLFQVYSFLRAYQNILNLNNLNLQSIMMCSIDAQKDKYHFNYIYKEQNITVLEFFHLILLK